MKQSRWRRAAILSLGLAAAPFSEALSEPGVSPKTGAELSSELGIGVASLTRAGPQGARVPDVAMQLAQRLESLPGFRGLGPERLGGGGAGEVGLRERAEEQGAIALVTGRTTQLGRKTSIDLRVVTTKAGDPIGSYVEEAAADELDSALQRLARRIARDVREVVESPSEGSAAVASAPPEAAKPPAELLRRQGPIQIRSEELEVMQGEGGGRHIRFHGQVRATQEGVRLRSERLEAFYPVGDSQPDRLEASGGVVVEDVGLDRLMRCDQATYFRAEDRVVCRGHAEMRQGADRLRGERIEIALDSGAVKVRGGVELNVRGQEAADEVAP